MDPYVVVSIDGNEVHRTGAAKWAHRKPTWETTCSVHGEAIPSSVTIAVWNSNRMRKDVLCGSVTVPCSEDMGQLEDKEFMITKKSQPSGTIRLSLSVLNAQPANSVSSPPRRTPPPSPLGAELDNVATWLNEASPKAGPVPSLRLAEPGCPLPITPQRAARQAMPPPEDDAPTLLSPARRRNVRDFVNSPRNKKALAGITFQKPDVPSGDFVPPTTPGSTKQDFSLAASLAEAAAAVAEEEDEREQREEDEGEAAQEEAQAEELVEEEVEEKATASTLAGSWNCVATQGLDDFLKATGVGAFQRKLASAARWPSWEFSLTGDRMHFINHSAMGDLKEDIVLDGSDYQHKDGRSNALTCSARWTGTATGGSLTISRQGDLGKYTEERRVDGDTLTFVLTNDAGASWGRTFQRAA